MAEKETTLNEDLRKALKESARPPAIRTKLNQNLAARLLFSYLSFDLAYILASVICYGVFFELKYLGKPLGFSFTSYTAGDLKAFDSFYDFLASVRYVIDKNGSEFISLDAGSYFQIIYFIGLILIVVQVISFIDQFIKGRKRNNKIIEAPLKSIADQADILSRVQNQATKFHDIEYAIENLQPAAPEARIEMGDQDLQGIEDALNNLLAQTHAAYQQQTQFVSDASHELRTPIAVIQGYADMLSRWGAEDQAVLKESIEAIQSEAQQMQVLVEQLLFLARGDAGRNPLEIEDLDLAQVMQEVHDEYEMIDKDHIWSLELDGPVKALGDKKMLKQALRILCDNAKRYSDPGTMIKLSAYYDEEGQPCLMVQDMGTGISQEDLPKIFDRFYRSDPARKREGGGTGLGLAISRWIISRHGGHFRVLSREGLGTRFTIILPK